MLSPRHLEVRTTRDARILPRWLSSADEVWLRELVAEAGACNGLRVGDVDARILDRVLPMAVAHGRSRRVVEAVWQLERRRWRSRVDAPVSPERIRNVVFDLAAERPREEALRTAARELSMRVEDIEASLFADRARVRRFVAPPVSMSSAEIVSSYNLALVQTLLGRSTHVTATLRANVRAVVRCGKLLGLMGAFDLADDGATRMTTSGPLALFHDTLKYGRALAKWFPAVVTTPGWSIDAFVLLRGEKRRLYLDASAPLPRTHALPRAHDSKLEARVERDLRRVGSPWRITRESDVVELNGRLFFPDFALTSEHGRVLVEVVGFWTPEYLAKKAELLRACPTPIVLCADARHAPTEWAGDPRVLPFRKSIDAVALIDRCERALATLAETPA